MGRVRRLVRAAIGAGLGAWWVACGSGGEPAGSGSAPGSGSALPRAVVEDGPHDVAIVRVAGHGVIRIELLPEIAPATVANFAKLASEGFYDGTTFHRVIPGFVIQGGDPNSRDNRDPRDDGKGGPGYKIDAEFSDFPHVRGVVSMARGMSDDSAGSQFFIVQSDSPDLDGEYTAFGRVVEGLDVVDSVTRVEIDTYGRYGPPDRPYPSDVVIESVRIEPAAAASRAPAP